MGESSRYYIYDLETLVNCFQFAGKFVDEETVYTFEVSDFKNDLQSLLTHLSFLQNSNVIMVGYSSLGFDYPILQELMVNPYTFSALKAYNLAQEIINSQTYGNAGFNSIRLSERLIRQVDLVKINHFDNKNKRTRLKDLQFAMRMPTLEDLPVPFDRPVTEEQARKLGSYNVHDILATEIFFWKCKHLIDMRHELLDNRVLTGDVLNYSDVKIGVEYLINRIGRDKCFIKGSTPRQSPRSRINFNELILPKVWFRTEPFNTVLNWFQSQSIVMDSKVNPKLNTSLGGLDFHFGLGGVHASLSKRTYVSNETHVIKDVDVAGMYVAVAITNGFYPQHLGEAFTQAYKQLQRDRSQYPKGTTMNAVLKLAGNGVYGNSNNPYSPFYDPKYTFTVTVNGQLQLLQLAELLSLIPGLELIQANTDGVTAYVPRELEHLFDLWCGEWEQETGLKLEKVDYSHMWIRDVNNYLARTTDGKLKRKGAYWYPETERDYEGVWNKDFSKMCVQKAIGQVLINGWSPETAVKLVTDKFDFMLRYKTQGAAKVFIGDTQVSKTVRYYVSKTGGVMKKIAPPKGVVGEYKRKNKISDSFYEKVKAEVGQEWDERIHTKNKSRYVEAVTTIESGWLVKECNDVSKFDWNDLNYDYYIEEIKKLVI